MSYNPERLQVLVLARLATPTKRALKQSEVCTSLESFVSAAIPASSWPRLFDELLDDLRIRGLIRRKPLALTDAGKERLRSYFGTAGEVNWVTAKASLFAAAQLGFDPVDQSVVDHLATPDGLRGAIVQETHGLPGSGPLSTTQAIDSWVWQLLGVRTTERLTADGLKVHLLRRELQYDGPADLAKLEQMFAARRLGLEGGDASELRLALAKRWLAGEPRDDDADHECDTVPAWPQRGNQPRSQASQPIDHSGNQVALP